jgi:heme ABC exporter ATP-binding subunit CcmA
VQSTSSAATAGLTVASSLAETIAGADPVGVDPAVGVNPAVGVTGDAISVITHCPMPPVEARPSLALRDAVVVLGSFPALSGLNLTVRPGEIVILRGPNGAGKSTLLRVCAGLLPLNQGRAVVLGHDLAHHRKTIRREVGFLSHAGFLYDDLTVAENIRFAVRAGSSKGRSESSTQLVLETMTALGLHGRVGDLPVSACSAGQRRRTSLAVVVARKPKLWLLDEPHTGLDAASRDLMDTMILNAAASGATVLLASHDGDRADNLATRTVHFSGGHLIGDEQVVPHGS